MVVEKIRFLGAKKDLGIWNTTKLLIGWILILLLELACVALINMFHSYPSAQGRMVKSKLKNGVGDILDNCSRFTAVLLNSIGVKYNKDSHPLGKEQTVKPKKCLDYIFIPYSTQYCGLCKILIGIFCNGFFDKILKSFLLSVV